MAERGRKNWVDEAWVDWFWMWESIGAVVADLWREGLVSLP
jgi:hypothetical protein